MELYWWLVVLMKENNFASYLLLCDAIYMLIYTGFCWSKLISSEIIHNLETIDEIYHLSYFFSPLCSLRHQIFVHAIDILINSFNLLIIFKK